MWNKKVKMYYKIILIFITNFLLKCDCARILAVFPAPSISHQVIFRPLTQELARRGHQLDIITADPAFNKGSAPNNITEIDVHDISYDVWRTNVLKSVTGKKSDLLNQMKVLYHVTNILVDNQWQIDGVQEILKRRSDYYDLLIIEACIRPALVFSHVFKAPVVLISSLGPIAGNYDAIGAPTHPILYPQNSRSRLYNLTLWEKITELYNHYSLVKLNIDSEEKENAVIKKHFGPDVPPISKLLDNVGMLFVNIHPILEGNFPVPPGVVHIWGIHHKPQKALPEDLQSFLDSSKHGVIYMSFGTNYDPRNLDLSKIQTFVRVYSKLPYDVLWKWDADVLPGKTDNIRIGKWFPQSDLLRHPNIKLFVTQGGLQSTDEAITAGVPLIGIPMLGDQWYNTEKYVHHKIGIQLHLESINVDVFKNAVETVIKDDSYRKNIVRLRALLNDQPQKPLDRATWWIEHVLRHGSDHLRSPAANIYWYQYLQLDVVFVLVAVIVVSSILLLSIFYYIYKFVKRNIFSGYKIKIS